MSMSVIGWLLPHICAALLCRRKRISLKRKLLWLRIFLSSKSKIDLFSHLLLSSKCIFLFEVLNNAKCLQLYAQNRNNGTQKEITPYRKGKKRWRSRGGRVFVNSPMLLFCSDSRGWSLQKPEKQQKKEIIRLYSQKVVAKWDKFIPNNNNYGKALKTFQGIYWKYFH